MLENIKSTYFSKGLFLHLDDKTKLELIKYNTKWQKILDINIFNYKIFSGKYIIYETKGNGKIFNALNNNLI